MLSENGSSPWGFITSDNTCLRLSSDYHSHSYIVYTYSLQSLHVYWCQYIHNERIVSVLQEPM